NCVLAGINGTKQNDDLLPAINDLTDASTEAVSFGVLFLDPFAKQGRQRCLLLALQKLIERLWLVFCLRAHSGHGLRARECRRDDSRLARTQIGLYRRRLR